MTTSYTNRRIVEDFFKGHYTGEELRQAVDASYPIEGGGVKGVCIETSKLPLDHPLRELVTVDPKLIETLEGLKDKERIYH
jgi:hypothetical protein